MTRVLTISSLWPPTMLGGAEAYAADLAAHLTATGDEVGVLTFGVEGDDVVASVKPWPYPVQDWAGQPEWKRVAFGVRDLYAPATTKALRKAVASFAPDVVHSHSVPGLSVTALSSPSRLGLAHVHTLHDYWLLCKRAVLSKRDGSLCQTRCTGCVFASGVRSLAMRRHGPHVVIGCSAAIAAEHRGFTPLEGRTRVVYHPVAPPTVVAPRPPAGRGVKLGYLGQLNPNKGVATLLDAVERAGAGASVVVAGRGTMSDLVEARQGPTVDYWGFVDAEARERFFATIDCLVVPSEWKEPAPLVINEAKARRVPVIGSDLGGIPELVPASCRSLVFPAGQVEALAASIMTFTADPSAHQVVDDDLRPDWTTHLTEIRTAYADAREAAT